MERVDENGRDHRSSIFYVFLLFHLPPCVCFIAMDGRRTRRRMKYKGFNEASLSLTHSLTHTHTHTQLLYLQLHLRALLSLQGFMVLQ